MWLSVLLVICAVVGTSCKTIDCDVVIAGGTTSSLSAAITSAQEGSKVCLLEPTDWIGGQLTASGVSAIDFAWHTVRDETGSVDVAKAHRDPKNQPSLFADLMRKVGSPGSCWVSTHCFKPSLFLDAVLPTVDGLVKSGRLVVFKETVVKNSTVAESIEGGRKRISSITAISRKFKGDPKVQCGGYDVLLSEDLADWYDPLESRRFSKEAITFTGRIFVDATEWGELLVLTGAPYLQGIAERFDGDVSGQGGSDRCGQAITFGFSEEIQPQDVEEPPNPHPDPRWDSYYTFEGYTWEKIWTYRRLDGRGSAPAALDNSLENWGGGNDFGFEHVLLSREDAAASARGDRWMGGVSVGALHDAETLAFGWHYFFKNRTSVPKRLTLSKSTWGTCHGLVKIPYMRDTRRSVGLNGFVMNVTMISGLAENVVGEVFPDRVALGAYNCDIHGMPVCKYPEYMHGWPILPYFVPLRALTNDGIDNLITSGKTIAQSFLVNSATRLQPEEWSIGTASGATASFMASRSIGKTSDLVSNPSLVSQLQQRISVYSPLRWTISGNLYPPN